MSFDPTDLSVKAALEAAADLSDDELDAIYETELDGKARKTLLDGLTDLRESLRESTALAAPAEASEPAESAQEEAPKERQIHPWAFTS